MGFFQGVAGSPSALQKLVFSTASAGGSPPLDLFFLEQKRDFSWASDGTGGFSTSAIVSVVGFGDVFVQKTEIVEEVDGKLKLGTLRDMELFK